MMTLYTVFIAHKSRCAPLSVEWRHNERLGKVIFNLERWSYRSLRLKMNDFLLTLNVTEKSSLQGLLHTVEAHILIVILQCLCDFLGAVCVWFCVMLLLLRWHSCLCTLYVEDKLLLWLYYVCRIQCVHKTWPQIQHVNSKERICSWLRTCIEFLLFNFFFLNQEWLKW